MNYKDMMKDYVWYINRYSNEELTADSLGKVHSYKGEYVSYLFSCYYKESLDHFIKRVCEENKQQDGKDEKILILPKKRHTSGLPIKIEYVNIDSFMMAGTPVVKNSTDLYHPIEATVSRYQNDYKKDQVSLALWWHDEEYSSHYMQGKIYNMEDNIPDDWEMIPIPESKYVVFSIDYSDKNRELQLDEDMKYLIYYAHTKWIAKYERKVDLQGYSFECIKDNRVYYCLALLEEDEEEPMEKIYGVDTWTDYINDNIFGNLTTASLAKKFHYSNTHFKRVFRYYYKMSVSDYIRKRRLTLIAEKIRSGMDYIAAAEMYGFKTYAGFKKAFTKEFNMSPAVYSKGVFEVIDLAKYYSEYKDMLRLSIVNLKPIHMIGHTVFPSKGADVDVAAQINYWIGKDFPCLQNTRFSCNIEQREDKIALWHYEPDTGDIEYILGPVVKEFSEDIPEEMTKVTLESGKYAIFETEKSSDEEDIAGTLRMYARCVFFGWVKEHRRRVDLERVTFERYVNGKIYLYVPLNY